LHRSQHQTEKQIVRIQLYPQGTPVRIRRGDYPLEAKFEGREGLVIGLKRRTGRRYMVQLEGESQLRLFDESELEATGAVASLAEAGAHQGGGGSDHKS